MGGAIFKIAPRERSCVPYKNERQCGSLSSLRSLCLARCGGSGRASSVPGYILNPILERRGLRIDFDTYSKAHKHLSTIMPSTEDNRCTIDDHERSVSDGDLEIEKKRRKARRRRANKNRFKPYHTLSPEEKMALGAAETARSERKTKDRMANGKPMAPSNTTQFLLEDREARAEQGREVELAYEASERRRVRSISVSSEFLAASEGGSTSGESETDKEMDKEFETEFEEYNMERISKLSKDQMTREILDKEKTADVYHDNLIKLMKENEHLKKVLRDNGIPFDVAQPVA